MRKKADGKSGPTEKKSASVQNLAANQSLTIDDFCRLEQFSRRLFYNLEKEGKAPQTYRAGTIRRITPEAHARWRAEREAESHSQAAA